MFCGLFKCIKHNNSLIDQLNKLFCKLPNLAEITNPIGKTRARKVVKLGSSPVDRRIDVCESHYQIQLILNRVN